MPPLLLLHYVIKEYFESDKVEFAKDFYKLILFFGEMGMKSIQNMARYRFSKFNKTNLIKINFNNSTDAIVKVPCVTFGGKVKLDQTFSFTTNKDYYGVVLERLATGELQVLIGEKIAMITPNYSVLIEKIE